MLSETLPKETYIYFDLFRYVVIPSVFGLLMWKRLKHIGKSRRYMACCFAGILVTFVMSVILLPLMAMYLDSNHLNALMNEIRTWSKSGRTGDFKFSTNGKIKLAIYHAFILALANWPLFAALYFGAGGPRSPRGNNLSNQTFEKENSALSLRTQMVS